MNQTLKPTPYTELNEVLFRLVQGARAALKENFVGAYLQGSFAIGDHSEFSDCDFIVVAGSDLNATEVDGLQTLHSKIYQSNFNYWHRNLEGSYAPRDILKRWSLEPRDAPGEPRGPDWGDPGMSGVPPRCYPFWYLNHGADYLTRSEHDNSQVVRWTLREKGVHLAGPDIKTLIDPIDPNDLKREVREVFDIAIASGLEMPNFSLQAFWVGLFCRILYTIETGEISSKKASMGWAQQSLDSKWQPLIADSMSLRKGDPEQAGAQVDVEVVELTRSFSHYCIEMADAMLKPQR